MTTELAANMKQWLFNPFIYIAGSRALSIGVIGALLSALINTYSNTHFDGALDVHFHVQRNIKVPIAENIISLLSLWIAFLLIAKFFTKSSFRIIDLFGTVALARLPLILLSLLGFLPFHKLVSDYAKKAILQSGESIDFSNLDLSLMAAMGVVTIVISAWMIALLYNAYGISTNLKGTKRWLSFVIGLIVAEIISKIILSYTYPILMG
ncbi:YIP1 family protein [Fulvivirgaceae bacterium BMA10]|uniref:YIP1 family protein n=1 Tax=Splendidivirga corallicola TaxID=3051826 RepID=A0ABT8KIM8_9BACT|nr:YIP1 family protein [Fulvivirgaceae bacterium BMA10]